MEQDFRLFHLNHLTDDVPPLDAWYDDVFTPLRGFHEDNQYTAAERRNLSLTALADVLLEPWAPAFGEKGWDDLPHGMFYKHFGAHWHSIALYANDVSAIGQDLTNAGIEYLGHGGRAPQPDDFTLFTHERDTLVPLQFMLPTFYLSRPGRDPRFSPGWDPDWWARNHPLGLIGLAYVTVIAPEPSKAVELYTSVLGGTGLGADTHSELTATRNSYVAMGTTVIEFACPTDQESLAAKDLDKNGPSLHAVAFRVRDLDVATEYLQRKGVEIAARDESTLLTNPETTFSVPFRFTTRDVSGDVRGALAV